MIRIKRVGNNTCHHYSDLDTIYLIKLHLRHLATLRPIWCEKLPLLAVSVACFVRRAGSSKGLAVSVSKAALIFPCRVELSQAPDRHPPRVPIMLCRPSATVHPMCCPIPQINSLACRWARKWPISGAASLVWAPVEMKPSARK